MSNQTNPTPRPSTTAKFNWNEGRRVTGLYHGQPFSGVIEKARPHSINWNNDEVTVKLDAVITVWDAQDFRSRVLMEVRPNGYANTEADNCYIVPAE